MLIAIEASHANKQNRTGVENVCYYLIQTLKKVIPSNVRVILYTNQPLSGELAVLPNINWSIKILRWPFFKGWSQFRLSWEFLFNKSDIFFVPGQLVPLISSKNTITIVHDSAFRAFPKAYWWGSRWYLRAMNWLVAKKSKLIITPSEFSKNEFLKYYEFDKEKIKVVFWGYDNKIFNFQFSISNQFSIFNFKKFKIDKPYLLSIGRLESKKNTQKIIQAFNLLKSKVTGNLKSLILNLKLCLVGSHGIGFQEIKKEIDNSPYKDDIILTGYVDQSELPILLQNAEIFIFPSLYEGFGLPILEAMACGCPVIASRGNSLEEVGGDAVEYAEYNNPGEIAEKMFRLLTDQNYKEMLIKKGLERVKNYSWEKAGESIWRVMNLFA
mgnify:CR=1 FL=1